jgi:hypothetical protein
MLMVMKVIKYIFKYHHGNVKREGKGQATRRVQLKV